PAHPTPLRSTKQSRPSAGLAACVARRLPIRRTKPQPAGSVRTALTRRSIGLPRIVERPLVQFPCRPDQLGSADLRQDTIGPNGAASPIPDRAAGDAVAIALAIDFETCLVPHSNARRQP